MITSFRITNQYSPVQACALILAVRAPSTGGTYFVASVSSPSRRAGAVSSHVIALGTVGTLASESATEAVEAGSAWLGAGTT